METGVKWSGVFFVLQVYKGIRGELRGGRLFGACSHKRWSLRLVAYMIDLERVERVGGCLQDTN